MISLTHSTSELNSITFSHKIDIHKRISNKLMAHLLVSKWGNSLAVRIPTEFIRQADLKDGDQLEIRIGADGSLCLQKNNWDRNAFAIELAQAQENMPLGSSVIEDLRNQARY
ncbi:MAG: AbrB/MazE/SpoVT family DNA-binding domain-containing protein [Sheuella sp.]|nr:AbrB/MazE/SpoVT family DNA-binding domain-containing protein [Sheuella sp.]